MIDEVWTGSIRSPALHESGKLGALLFQTAGFHIVNAGATTSRVCEAGRAPPSA